MKNLLKLTLATFLMGMGYQAQAHRIDSASVAADCSNGTIEFAFATSALDNGGMYRIDYSVSDGDSDTVAGSLSFVSEGSSPTVYASELIVNLNGDITGTATLEQLSPVQRTWNTADIDGSVECDGDLASIGDRVWLDSNADGIQNCTDSGNGILGDAGDVGPECDAGVPDVLVRLNKDFDGICANAEDEFFLNTTTDDNGFYLFSGVVPGQYCMAWTRPDGTTCTMTGVGGIDADSDGTSVGDGTICRMNGVAPIILASGEVNRTLDLGLVPDPTNCDDDSSSDDGSSDDKSSDDKSSDDKSSDDKSSDDKSSDDKSSDDKSSDDKSSDDKSSDDKSSDDGSSDDGSSDGGSSDGKSKDHGSNDDSSSDDGSSDDLFCEDDSSSDDGSSDDGSSDDKSSDDNSKDGKSDD